MPHQLALSRITSRTLKALSPQTVVLPEQYATKFREFLIEEGLISVQDELVQEVSTANLDQAQGLMDKTQSALGSLDGYVTTAREAIVTKDTDSLDGVLGLIHSMQAEIEQLRGEVYVDGLTRIYNRKWIFDKLLDKEGAFVFDGSMAFVDVNSFKALNDNFGHDVGDRVLTYIGKVLKQAALSHTDPDALHVVRYAGDEFALLGKISQQTLEKLMLKTQGAITEKTFKTKANTFKIAFSYGVSGFEKGEDFMVVLKRADGAMYENKKLSKQTRSN